MLHKYFAILAIVFLFISNVNAQDVDRSGGYARVQALGQNPYVVDPEFMKFNPAWGQFYDNFLWADIGENAGTPYGDESSGQFFGVNFRLDRAWTLGLLLSRDDFNSQSISTIDPFNITQNHSPRLNNNLEVFTSLSLSSNTHLGLGVAYASASTENNSEVVRNTSASQLGISLGLIQNFSTNTMLDLGFNIVMPKYSTEEPDFEVSQTIIAANGRLFMKMNNKIRLVPNVNFLTASGDDLSSVMSIGVGVGLEYTVGDFMFIGGPSFRTTSITDNNPEISMISFPVWNIGAEWDATDWLVARLGYISETGYTSAEFEGIDGERISTFYSPGLVTMGVGFRFGDFGLDATINSDVLRQGLGNIGGQATFAYLSASYAF